MALAEAAERIGQYQDAPLLVHGNGDEAADYFALLAHRLGYGTAVVLTGLRDGALAGVQAVADRTDFRTWHTGPEFPGLPPGARTWIKSYYDGGTYSTHLPVLIEAVRRTTGSVLELGAGDGSTPALHALCASTGRLLVTVDSNGGWLSRYARMASEWHIMQRLDDPSQSAWLDAEWSAVFIDHSPGETRGRAIERAREKADFLVIHDTEELGYGLEPILSAFRHRKDFRRARPWTTVVSMTREIW